MRQRPGVALTLLVDTPLEARAQLLLSLRPDLHDSLPMRRSPGKTSREPARFGYDRDSRACASRMRVIAAVTCSAYPMFSHSSGTCMLESAPRAPVTTKSASG